MTKFVHVSNHDMANKNIFVLLLKPLSKNICFTDSKPTLKALEGRDNFAVCRITRARANSISKSRSKFEYVKASREIYQTGQEIIFYSIDGGEKNKLNHDPLTSPSALILEQPFKVF